ncbi:MAG: ABC transporter permease subunit [Alphaproteobacteria bacterium]|nr:ABC transporter permease subunit [Alphaproteobacteria bacterium]
MNDFVYKWRNPIFGSVSVVLFFLGWEALLTWAIPLNPFIMSKPSLIFEGLWLEMQSGQLWSDLLISGQPFIFGFGAAIVVGIFVGTMMGWRARVGYALDPLLTALYASPLVAIAPLVIIFFGVGVSGKAILIFVLCVFPFVFNTYAGVKSVDRLLVNVVRSLGGNERDIYLKVIVPSVLPFIIAGARYAIGRALVGILVGEFFAATAGIGYRIAWFSDMFELSRMFGYILVMMVVAVLFTEGIRWAERAAFPWRVGM